MGFVQINKGPGDEITRITFRDIESALDGKDLNLLRSSLRGDAVTPLEVKNQAAAEVMEDSKYKVACLKMKKRVDQWMLEDCLNQNAKKGWVLKSITRIENYSTMRAVLDTAQYEFELVVVFERR